jgi:indolepyruvate ferredoxin oxidoreductase beta subunit
MKCDIILAGVGGQGILSIAATIGLAAVEKNLFLKQSEVHGMSQRGGDVQSHLRLSDTEIHSDLIPDGKADLIISVEPMEALRYLPWLSPEGWIVTSSVPFVNIPDYPGIDDIMSELKKAGNTVVLDADAIAKDLGSSRSGNMVILGAASSYISLPFESLENAVRQLFNRKGEEVVDLNLKALRAGRDAAGSRKDR